MCGNQESRNKNVLLIKVDWNGRLQPGTALSPKFTFSGVGLQFPPSVSCKMERFTTAGWNEEPKMYPVPGGKGWYFQQPLTIPNDLLPGTYFINVDAVFQKEDPSLPGTFYSLTYHAPIQFDIGQNDAAGPLVIRATGNAVINTRNYDWNTYEREIVIEADENAIINLSKAASADQNTAPEEDDGNDAAGNTKPWLFKFEPIGIKVDPPPRDTLLLTAEVDDGKTYLYSICAKRSVVLGRGENKVVDFVYRLGFSDDPDVEMLNKYFSDRQLMISVDNDGLTFRSLSDKAKTKLQNSQKAVCLLDLDKEGYQVSSKYSFSDLKRECLTINLRDVAHLEMKGYPDPKSKETNAGVDVFVLERKKDLPVLGNKKEHLEGKYPGKCDFEKPCWREDPYSDTLRYLLILRSASIGTCGSIVPGGAMGMAQHHAAIYFCDNRFVLVNYDQNPFSYCMYNEKCNLQQKESTPLIPGMTFKIGNVKFHVYESYSSWLNIQRTENKNAL